MRIQLKCLDINLKIVSSYNLWLIEPPCWFKVGFETYNLDIIRLWCEVKKTILQEVRFNPHKVRFNIEKFEKLKKKL